MRENTTYTIEIAGLIRKEELLQALNNNGIDNAKINDIIENLPQYGMKLTNAVEKLAKSMGCEPL